MALRTVRVAGDPVLTKTCRVVKEVTPRIRDLIGDMLETMYAETGVGLAAPQVGVLKRIVVIDCTGEDPYVFINPVITEKEGEQTGDEGCLSVPGKVATVTRPARVVVEAFDEEMEPFTLEAEELFARAICHEVDHLEGHLYTELAEGPIRDVRYENEEESEEE